MRDVLALTLRTLKPGEGIECSRATYFRIKDRLQTIIRSYVMYKFMMRVEDGVAHIRRVD